MHGDTRLRGCAAADDAYCGRGSEVLGRLERVADPDSEMQRFESSWFGAYRSGLRPMNRGCWFRRPGESILEQSLLNYPVSAVSDLPAHHMYASSADFIPHCRMIFGTDSTPARSCHLPQRFILGKRAFRSRTDQGDGGSLGSSVTKMPQRMVPGATISPRIERL